MELHAIWSARQPDLQLIVSILILLELSGSLRTRNWPSDAHRFPVEMLFKVNLREKPVDGCVRAVQLLAPSVE
jgi:hypothetical protein